MQSSQYTYFSSAPINPDYDQTQQQYLQPTTAIYPQVRVRNRDWSKVPEEIVPHAKQGAIILKKYGMEHHQARVKVILDVSASMQNPNGFYFELADKNTKEYKTGKVQRLLNKSLAMAFLFDDAATIDIIPFGDKAYPTVTVNFENYINATDLVMQSIGDDFARSTNYASAIRALRERVFNDKGPRYSHTLRCDEDPVFTIFVTDGEPNDEKDNAISEFCYASFEAVFIKLLALKGHEEDFDFLNNLENGVKGRMHFCNFDFETLKDPDDLTMELLIKKYRGWLEEAHRRKMLTKDPNLSQYVDEKAEGRWERSSSNSFFCCCSADTVDNEVNTQSRYSR